MIFKVIEFSRDAMTSPYQYQYPTTTKLCLAIIFIKELNVCCLPLYLTNAQIKPTLLPICQHFQYITEYNKV